MTAKKIEVKKVEIKKNETRLEDWRILREWAINSPPIDVSYHSMEPEVDIWMGGDSLYHIKLMPNGTWEIQ